MSITFTGKLSFSDVTSGTLTSDGLEVEGLLYLEGVIGRHVELKVFVNPVDGSKLLLDYCCEDRDLSAVMHALAETYVALAYDDLVAAVTEWLAAPFVEGEACVTRRSESGD